MTKAEIGLSIFAAIVLAVVIIFSQIARNDGNNKTANRFLLLIIPAATTWLWVPWVLLVVTVIERKNTGLVHDLAKPEIVLPATDSTRPSKADEGKQEATTNE